MDFARVDRILAGGGTLRLETRSEFLGDGNTPELFGMRGQPNYQLCESQIGVNDITLQALAMPTSAADSLNVGYIGDFFTFGRMRPPGFIYSDGFAGCSFYLYRGMDHEIYGVHASRERGKVRDPQQHFTQIGAKLLWQWNSLDQLSTSQLMAGNFGAVLCCVGREKIQAYALCMDKTRVASILASATIEDWQRHEQEHQTPPASTPVVYAVAPLSRLQRLLRWLRR